MRRDVGAGAVADVVERRHLVHRGAAEVVAEVGGGDDGIIGAGGLISTSDILGAQRLDLAGFEAELAAWFDEAEGEGAVLVRPVPQGDFADGEVHLLDGSGVKGVGFRHGLEVSPRVEILTADVADAPATQLDVEDEGEGFSVGDHRDALELDRDIVGIMDHDDRVDSHAERAVRVEAVGVREDSGEDHRETNDARREAHRCRPGARGRLRDIVEISVAACRARYGNTHAVEVGGNVRRHHLRVGVIMAEDVRVTEALFGLETRRIARRRKVVAVKKPILGKGGECRPSVELVRQGGLVPLSPACTVGLSTTLHGCEAVAGSVGQGLDAAGDDGIGWRCFLAAEGGGGELAGLFDLALIHAVVVAVEIPGRSADDATDQVLDVSVEQFWPRAHIDARREGVGATGDGPRCRGGVGALLRVGEEARVAD